MVKLQHLELTFLQIFVKFQENFPIKITLLHSLGEASPCLATTSSMNAAGKRRKLINRGNFRTGTARVIIGGFAICTKSVNKSRLLSF